MNMPDKDIDALFSSKLKHLETEPSAQVWKSITLELDGAKRPGKLLPVIGIAASLLLVLSTGLFLLLKDSNVNSITVNKNHKPALVNDDKIENSNKTIARILRPAVVAPEPPHGNPVRIKGNEPYSAHRLIKKNTEPVQHAQTKAEIIVDKQPELAAANTEHRVVPDVPLMAHQDVTVNDKFITMANPEVPELGVAKQKTKKHGIRTLGDIINVVVAKVDKRENKIIEFSDTDDDGSVVSGLNLGIIRIKKGK